MKLKVKEATLEVILMTQYNCHLLINLKLRKTSDLVEKINKFFVEEIFSRFFVIFVAMLPQRGGLDRLSRPVK